MDHFQVRSQIHTELLQKLQKVEQDYFGQLNRDLYVKIDSLLNESFTKWSNIHEINNKVIDVGVLLLGVNTSDHTITFTNLSDTIRNSSRCNVIRINSSNCKTIKKVMEVVVNSIISADDLSKLNVPNSLKYTVHSLKLYAELKKKLERDQIVLILEDVELLNVNLLHNIISIVSAILPYYPIAMLMCLSSSMETLNEMLSASCLSRISIQIFQTPTPATLLNNFMLKFNEALMPFQLSNRVYSYIVNHMFLYLDYSMENLIYRIKFCLLEHIMHNDKALNMFLEQDKTSNDSTIKKHIEHFKLTNSLIHWLLDLFKDLAATKLGNQFYQLLGVQLNQGIGESDSLKAALDLFRTLTPEEAAQSVRRANSNMANEKENNVLLSQLLETSEKFAHRFLNRNMDEVVKVTAPIATVNTPQRKQSIRGQHQKELLKRIEADKLSPKVSTPLEDFCVWLRDWLASNLPHYKTMLGYEGVYFDDLRRFKEAINPQIKSAVETALLDPGRYLGSERVQNDPRLRPDTCILFKLQQECPRLINIYDLLQAFCIQIGEDTSEKPPTHMAQCRFMQAVSELQLLGIVKGKGKTVADHLERVTWPGLF